jgi:NitT/TauT family transport system permease protein
MVSKTTIGSSVMLWVLPRPGIKGGQRDKIRCCGPHPLERGFYVIMLRQPFALRDVVRAATPHRLPALLADAAVLLGTLALFALIARIGAGAFVRFVPPHEVPSVSLDPRYLPYYAARSTLRMFPALGASLLFTLLYGYVAAKSRRTERVLIPLLDILQSVPVLGFLSITVTGFIALFPGSLLGLELASIFAIFTSQA